MVTPAMVEPDPRILTVLDTSASMHVAAYEAALSEIEAICKRTAARSHHTHEVVTADEEITSTQRVRNARQVRLVGGGGTDMARAIHQASARRPRPDIIIVITDGATSWPGHRPPGIKVIIVVINDDLRPARVTPDWATTVTMPLLDSDPHRVRP